ncbi:tetratricopeptide repeat protein 7B-like [Paramacrobiotus metropolitanus]|uniref:tetratricopeptide repeat protein 7B-like n=1 Tax=Paramacrobiotus metropolitanus TaxID=2943436 RepID=UPI0024460B7B|nr:tetratricopeptide repeat protein 7B-like [Paramacrobiotus metropolitanus]XP_055329418.1 tetratricopeptide repeat protein 7B-like [Paramacrobiotus metropolitanus]
MPPPVQPANARTDIPLTTIKSPIRAELEKLRQEGLWDRILELASENQKAHHSSFDPVVSFYQAEARLEQIVDFLRAQQLTVVPDESKKALVEVKNLFTQLLKTPLPTETVRLGWFLLGKTYFLLDDFKQCNISLDKGYISDIDISHETNRRNLKTIAEGFCLKGCCLWKNATALTTNGKVKREEVERIMSNFEIANDLSLSCGQMDISVRESLGLTGDLTPFQLGDLLESALKRTPNMYAKHGMLSNALIRFRESLRAMESPSTRKVRLTLARQLLEMLLRGYLGIHYIGPRSTERKYSTGAAGTSAAPRPKKYLLNGSFIPLAILEEIVLLLYICEAIIVRDLASRPLEDPISKKLVLMSATAVGDLGTIAFSRLHHISLGIPFLERAAKSCPNSQHIWRQFAMSLIVKNDFGKALHVIEQFFRFMPKDRTLLVFASKICLDNLSLLDRGIFYAEEMAKLPEKSRHTGRARMVLGVAHSLKALRARDIEQEALARGKAISYLLQAEAEDPGDYLIHYHLALEYCMDRRMDDAFRQIKKCLRMNMDYLPAHHLLALILSCSHRYEDALSVLEKCEIEFSEDVEIELTKIRLQAKIQGAENALKSCRHLLWSWKAVYEKDLREAERERMRTTSPEVPYPVSPLAYNAQFSPLPLTFPNNSLTVANPKISPSGPGGGSVDRADTLSYRAESGMTLPRGEGTISEMASTTGSYLAKANAQRAFSSQLHIWVLMAELYLSLDQPDNAVDCLSEAAMAGPPSFLVFYLQGSVLLRTKGPCAEARRFFENALAVNPWHAPSHIQIGWMLRKEGYDDEAERHFREALQGDSTCFEAWAALGELYFEKGNDEMAMEYLDRARRMEMSQPIQPFHSFSRCISY